MLDLSIAMLVRNPPLDRLAMQMLYMSEVVPEFIIVDTGSTNEELNTMASWNQHPFSLPKVQIIQRDWRDDFAWARNEALPFIKRKWTLALDPDELPSIKMMKQLEYIVTEDPKPDALGYLFYTPDYFNGRRDPYYEYQWHCRLFRSGHGKWYRALDELVLLDGKGEHETRETPVLPKAPADAILIHSKGSGHVEKAKALYDKMKAEGKDKLKLEDLK